MDSDRPLKPGNKDRLGFAPLAKKLARLIMDQSSKSGLVLGIEGEWGSGKSSLLARLKEELEQKDKETKDDDEQETPSFVVVDFKPWLISDRDSLIGSFLGNLAHTLADKYEKQEDAKETIIKLRQYAVLASSIGAGAKLAGHLIPGVGVIGEGLKQVEKLFDDQAEMTKHNIPTLEEQSEQVCASLKEAKFRIMVIIDDLDRLEAKRISRGDGIVINEHIEYYHSLDGRALKYFLDMDTVSQRLEKLAAGKNNKQAERAKELLENLKRGNDWE